MRAACFQFTKKERQLVSCLSLLKLYFCLRSILQRGRFKGRIADTTDGTATGPVIRGCLHGTGRIINPASVIIVSARRRSGGSCPKGSGRAAVHCNTGIVSRKAGRRYMQVALRKQRAGIGNCRSCSRARTVFDGRIQHSSGHGIQFGGRRQAVAFRTGIARLRLIIQRSVCRNIGRRTAAATPKTAFLSRGFRSPVEGGLRNQNELAMPGICPARGFFIRSRNSIHQCTRRG